MNTPYILFLTLQLFTTRARAHTNNLPIGVTIIISSIQARLDLWLFASTSTFYIPGSVLFRVMHVMSGQVWSGWELREFEAMLFIIIEQTSKASRQGKLYIAMLIIISLIPLYLSSPWRGLYTYLFLVFYLKSLTFSFSFVMFCSVLFCFVALHVQPNLSRVPGFFSLLMLRCWDACSPSSSEGGSELIDLIPPHTIYPYL